MDGKSCCDLMSKLSVCGETQRIQLARPFCADPVVTLHTYPETPNQVTCSEDLSFLPFVSEHLVTENFYSEPCTFPYQMSHSNYHRSECSYGPAFIRKRNERERQRVKCVNEGYAKLRHHLPEEYVEKRLSKVETLRAAIKYISYLQSVLYSDSVVAEKKCPGAKPMLLIADHDRFLQVAAFAGMSHSTPDHRFCSAIPALDKFLCSSVSPCCRSSFVVHPAWIAEPRAPQRCQWLSHCLPSSGPAWKRLSPSGRSVGLDSNVPVLVRREQDGFYYRGTVKEETESDRGMFLVEFAKPPVSRGRHPVCVQKTGKDDILEYVNGMKHSLLPGDKVLAPWEPDMARYGPGTVLTGIETRDPLRASEDEEITVQFWNNKKVKLPRGVALWIPPSLWERVIEMIHMPFTSRMKPGDSLDTNSCIFSCSPKLALAPVCALHLLAKHCFPCSPCWPRFHCHCDGVCCLSAPARCLCCCHPHFGAWWPLPSRSLLFQSKTEETESSSEPSPHLLELEGPKQEEPAAVEASPPSSDSEWDLEPFPTESAVVDSADNSGSGCLEKPRLKGSARPEDKYWRRSHYKSHLSNSGPGTRSSTCRKDKSEPKAVSVVHMSHVTPTNRRAMFETIEQSPGGQLTVEEIPRDEDFKPSLGARRKILQYQKTKDIKRQERKQSDDKRKATCIEDYKVDNTDRVRKQRTHNKAERDMINENSINVQLMKFRS
ncbi:hypothetical protein AV530_013311 [Patagioenas fasciata monilis]|uniref:BHLH domain-containing protein n=1 Tax=Patagioenas fasciata monilis TaxID=372326 RepID=A0A1V4JP43_PATFA|nr:hypothetical protein AV530_013311 [Patagioenas fasciata monilis]